MNGYIISWITHTMAKLTDIVLEELGAVSSCDVLRVGYDNELAVPEAGQAVGL
jgi:hypothetical protein